MPRNDNLLNPLQNNGIFHKATYNKVRMVHYIFRGATGYDFKTNNSVSFKIDFTLANSAKPIEMPRYVAFHLGLSCLQKYLLGLPV